jgi:hypothetical protein
MPGQFRVHTTEIVEAGRAADGLGQSLRVSLTLSDQNGEQPPTESVTIAAMVECANNEGYIEIQAAALERARQLIADQLAEISKRRGRK